MANKDEDLRLDDENEEIIDLLEVVKPGKVSAEDAESEDVDFSKDLESMLDSLSQAEKAKAGAFPDPTPVDHEVDHNESLDLPDMDDLDGLLESLGADAPKKSEPLADAAPDPLDDDLADLDAAPLAGASGKSAPPAAPPGDRDEFAALLGALDGPDDSEEAAPSPAEDEPEEDLLAELVNGAEIGDSLAAAPPQAPASPEEDDPFAAALAAAVAAAPPQADLPDDLQNRDTGALADASGIADADAELGEEAEAPSAPDLPAEPAAAAGQPDSLTPLPDENPDDVLFDEELDAVLDAALGVGPEADMAVGPDEEQDVDMDAGFDEQPGAMDVGLDEEPGATNALDAPDAVAAAMAAAAPDDLLAEAGDDESDELLDTVRGDIASEGLDADESPDAEAGLDIDAGHADEAPSAEDRSEQDREAAASPAASSAASAAAPSEAPESAPPRRTRVRLSLEGLEPLKKDPGKEAASLAPVSQTPPEPTVEDLDREEPHPSYDGSPDGAEAPAYSGTRLDEVDLVELDALLDDMLAGAPASGPGPGFVEAPAQEPAAPVPPAPEDEAPLSARSAGRAADAGQEEWVVLHEEINGLRRDLNEALALLSQGAAAGDAAAGDADAGDAHAGDAAALAARLEDIELTLSARASEDDELSRALHLHADQLGLLDGRVEVLDDMRERVAELGSRMQALEARVEDLSANLDKLAAEAAARVIREELAALMAEQR